MYDVHDTFSGELGADETMPKTATSRIIMSCHCRLGGGQQPPNNAESGGRHRGIICKKHRQFFLIYQFFLSSIFISSLKE